MNFATSCKSSNIIYLITYRRCSQQYVGKTGQPLHRRVNNHCFNIVHRRTEESPVTEHFNDNGHTLEDMTVAVIDQIHSRDPCLRKIRESRWIRTLGTSFPSGMNLRVDSLWKLLDDHPLTRVSMCPADIKATGFSTSHEHDHCMINGHKCNVLLNIWSMLGLKKASRGRNVETKVCSLPNLICTNRSIKN